MCKYARHSRPWYAIWTFIAQARSQENGLPILFVHPAEFLVTDSQGEIRSRTILGDRLEIATSEINGQTDQNEVFFFDLPVKR
jgi:hypothetical protein